MKERYWATILILCFVLGPGASYASLEEEDDLPGCMYQIGEAFKKISNEGLELDMGVLGRIAPGKVSNALVNYIDGDFSLSVIQNAYIAVFVVDINKIDHSLRWEDAILPPAYTPEMLTDLRRRLNWYLESDQLDFEELSDMENGPRVNLLEDVVGDGFHPDEGDVVKACEALSEQLWGSY